MSAFVDVLAAYAALPDTALDSPWEWPGREGAGLEVRDALLHSLELELAAAARPEPQAVEAARAVALAQQAFGDLRGLLCGQADAVLDAEPGGGEWTLRHVLQHVLWVERRYQLQTTYAASRSDDDPMRREPEVATEDAPTVAAWIAHLEAARDAGLGLLDIADDRLTRPAIWTGHAVDVRFRLHRFTGHLAQHTVHAEKILRRLGRLDGEARQLVRRISAARGSHELLSDTAALRHLDRQHQELLRSIGA